MEILLADNIPSETVTGIMMLKKNTKSLISSPAEETSFFDTKAEFLQVGTLIPFLFAISPDCVLRSSFDKHLHLQDDILKNS